MSNTEPTTESTITITVKCVTCGKVDYHTIFRKYLWKYVQNEDRSYTRASKQPATCSLCDPTNPDVYYGDEPDDRLRFLREHQEPTITNETIELIARQWYVRSDDGSPEEAVATLAFYLLHADPYTPSVLDVLKSSITATLSLEQVQAYYHFIDDVMAEAKRADSPERKHSMDTSYCRMCGKEHTNEGYMTCLQCAPAWYAIHKLVEQYLLNLSPEVRDALLKAPFQFIPKTGERGEE